MALISRLSRLFKADFHAVLDQIEEPETQLRQSIREMEDELQNSEMRMHNATQDIERLVVRQQELDEALQQIEEELDVCFESGEDKLARDLIRRKLQTERFSKRVDARLSSAKKSCSENRKTIDDNRAALESLQQKAELFAERSSTRPESQQGVDEFSWQSHEIAVTDNDVDVAFLREKKRRVN